MSAIREALDTLADVLEEALASVGKGKKGAPADEPDEPEAPARGKKPGKKAAVTMEQVREAMVALNSEHGKPALIDVLSRFGVTKLGDLPEEHFAEAKELAENYEPEAAAEDDDDPLGEGDGDDNADEPEDEPEPPRRKRNRK